MSTTTTDLIEEVRQLASEFNTTPWSDDAILAAATRGLRYVVSKMVEDYPDPLLVRAELATTAYSSTDGLALPTECYEDRVVFVQMDTPGRPTPVEARTSRTAGSHESTTTAAIPSVWYPRGRAIFFAPPPSGAHAALLDYVKRPDPYVRVLGRVTSVGATYLIVDDPSDDLSSAGDEVASYINVIDGRTGEVRCSLQIGFIEDGKLTIRETPIAATKLGRTISAASDMAGLDVAEDDYVCAVRGTCVPQFGDAFTSYIVDYAASCITRSLAETRASIDEAIARRAAEAASQQRAGRNIPRRVRNTSAVWGGRSFIWPRSSGSS